MTQFKILLYIAMMTATVYATYCVLDWRADSHALAAEKALHAADLKQCKADKLITEEANRDLQNDRDAIAINLAAAKRMHPDTCLAVIPGQASIVEAGAGHASVGRTITGTTDDFRDYFARCRTYQSERIRLEQAWDKAAANLHRE